MSITVSLTGCRSTRPATGTDVRPSVFWAPCINAATRAKQASGGDARCDVAVHSWPTPHKQRPAKRLGGGAGVISSGNAPMGLYPCKPHGPTTTCTSTVIVPTPTVDFEVVGKMNLSMSGLRLQPGVLKTEFIDEFLMSWTSVRTKAEAMEEIGSAGVPCGAVYDTMELYQS